MVLASLYSLVASVTGGTSGERGKTSAESFHTNLAKLQLKQKRITPLKVDDGFHRFQTKETVK